MHRRARHLNPKAAGATLVLDARYIAGNDGDAIGTWSDRSGNANDATQGTAADKPLLKTGANGLGGNSVLYFGSTDKLVLTSPPTQAQDMRILCVTKRSASNKDVTAMATGSDYLPAIGLTSSGVALMATRVKSGSAADTSLNSILNGAVIGSRSDNGSYSLRSAGVTLTLSVVNYAFDSFTWNWIGARGGVSSDGNVGAVYAFPGSAATMATPLLRRLENSLALTWKIPCA
jgi:hypothetical protein